VSHVVARIGRPHGLRGEVTVRLHTDDPARRFRPGARFPTEALAGTDVPDTLTLLSARDHNGVWLLTFEQASDRTGAEGLRGVRLLAPIDPPSSLGTGQSATTDPDDEGWYEEELVGLSVQRTDGTAVGTVSGLQLGAAQDQLVVALATGGTAYLPFVEAIVPVVDPPGGRVVIDPPEGLLELT
jgi:16S rRNA processing protein RimM